MADLRPMDEKEQTERDLKILGARVGVVNEQRKDLEEKLARERAQFGDLLHERDLLLNRWSDATRKINDFRSLVYDAEGTLRRLHRKHPKPEACTTCRLIARLNRGRTTL